MLFNSYEFIFLFLPLTFFIYFYLNSKKLTILSKVFLIISSLFFYSWWNIIYLPLILLSIIFNFFVGEYIYNKKSLLYIGIIFNLSLLGYFKYMDFFIENINFFTNSNFSLFHLALPLAISFYTFQQIAYLVDSYRGDIKEYHFLDYVVFVTFFPQLIAGPIVHHSEMMPQFNNKKNLVKNYKNIALGIFIFSIGLFKKVAIADSFAVFATQGFDVATSLNMIEAWLTSFSYTFQLYFDFSGYTDMAIGIALLFNIKLPINFNSPYKALSIQDFWRRWHITLSDFLKRYIYIPLGGNRLGETRTYLNLFITFLLGGIWHGAGWTFVFWGAMHGSALAIHRLWQKFNFKIHFILAWFITFNFVNISWVFFRAKEWEDAIKVLDGMFFGEIILPQILSSKLSFLSISSEKWSSIFYSTPEIFVWIILGFIISLFFKNSMQLREKFIPTPFYMLWTILSLMSIFILYRKSEFIYFNF
ncbi:Probable poly(beta-D-mannuronate) O-acetylase [hydrothermal vent metagenome]|uniref:Probable poly(Beta-D-mannuronate) O-acetylase n=1 Tax=hydrothermal vent metagenome TaxID=652676 RepID=A0A1W1BJ62_9ZZZZ